MISRLRRARLPIRYVSLIVAALAISLLAPTPPASAEPLNTKTRNLAAEICEDMVRDSAVAAAREPLAVPQVGTWSGRRYTCAYAFAGGALLIRVDAKRSSSAAKASFLKFKKSATNPTVLSGIGQRGFERGDGTIVAQKDNFVLIVDPTHLPARLNRDSITWSATRAIFDCW